MKNEHTQVVDFSNPNADKITSDSTKAMTNNKQQTAVEWLINSLNSYDKVKEMFDCFEHEIKQAKEMEKEQIEKLEQEIKLLKKYIRMYENR